MSESPRLVALPMTSDEAFHQEAARCIDQIKHQFQADQARLITRISHGGTLPEMRAATDAAWLLGEILNMGCRHTGHLAIPFAEIYARIARGEDQTDE